MCTVSFLPKPHGFYLAVNRDEKRDRFAALAPTIVELKSHRVVFPREPIGGTWQMIRATHAYTKTDAWAARFRVPVAPDAAATLKYRVRVTY